MALPQPPPDQQLGPSDVEVILSEQLMSLQIVMMECQRACAAASQKNKTHAQLESDVTRLETENERLSNKMIDAGYGTNLFPPGTIHDEIVSLIPPPKASEEEF